MARIAEDNDFDQLKTLVDESEGWVLELDKADTKVWTKSVDGCSFQMVKIQTIFADITAEVLYDVLHDPDYRCVKFLNQFLIFKIKKNILIKFSEIFFF
jgi:hypothetical protein